MSKWSLQDIRPGGEGKRDRGEKRGEIYNRPLPRKVALSSSDRSDVREGIPLRASARSEREAIPRKGHVESYDLHQKKIDDSYNEEEYDDMHEEPRATPRVMRGHRPIDSGMMQDGGRVRETRSRDMRDTWDEEDIPPQEPPRAFRDKGIPLRPSPVLFYAKVIVAFLFLGAIATFFLMNSYAKASIVVVPKQMTKEIASVSLTAQPEGEGLLYSTITYEQSADAVVKADGSKDVSELASGDIAVYNEFSEKPFQLKKNTRFEAEGKIFRLQESVTIPGYTKGGDGKVTPGTVIAKVFADKAGVESNVGPTTFTLPGLAESPDEYSKIYAKSQTAFSGGFVGKEAIVKKEDKDKAIDDMKRELTEILRSNVAENRPAGQVLYMDSAVFTFTELPLESIENGSQARVKIKGVISVPSFAVRDIANNLAGHVIEGYNNENYSMRNPEDLSFAYVTGSSTSSPEVGTGAINFSLSGTATFMQELQKEQLAKDVLGIKKDDIQSLIAKYGSIERVSYEIKPSWKQNFPDKEENITVEIAIPE